LSLLYETRAETPADRHDIRPNDSFTHALRAHLKVHLLHEVSTAVGN
jgi:hypothetical protein